MKQNTMQFTQSHQILYSLNYIKFSIQALFNHQVYPKHKRILILIQLYNNAILAVYLNNKVKDKVMIEDKQINIFSCPKRPNFASTFLFVSLLILQYLDVYFEQQITYHVSTNIFYFIQDLEFWRLFPNQFFQRHFLVIVIIFIHLYLPASHFESKNCTTIILLQYLTIGITIQLICLLYQGFVYLLNDNFLSQKWHVAYHIGNSGLFINMFFKYLYFNFEQINKIIIKKNVCLYFLYLYPLFLTVVISIICNEIRIDMIAGYFLGLIECFYLKGGIIHFSFNFYYYFDLFFRCFLLNYFPILTWIHLNAQSLELGQSGLIEKKSLYVMKHSESWMKQPRRNLKI